MDKQAVVNEPNWKGLWADGIIYINTNQWVLAHSAFALLYQSTKEKSVALLYNRALCHFAAKECAKAIALLAEALTKLAKPSVLQNPTNDLPNDLLVNEYESNFYRLALNETAAGLNTGVVKLRIRRLLVDANLEMENWQEIIRLSALPEMDKCKNVRNALAIAQGKLIS